MINIGVLLGRGILGVGGALFATGLYYFGTFVGKHFSNENNTKYAYKPDEPEENDYEDTQKSLKEQYFEQFEEFDEVFGLLPENIKSEILKIVFFKLNIPDTFDNKVKFFTITKTERFSLYVYCEILYENGKVSDYVKYNILNFN
jgi:uncharacterized protein YfbU (UPF0304 family)